MAPSAKKHNFGSCSRTCQYFINEPIQVLFGHMVEGAILYKLPYFGSSKIFELEFFGDYVITLSTAISRDWSKIETI